MRTNSRVRASLLYFMLAVAVVAAGLILRLVPLGLPFLLVKYGGSALWAVMVYLLLAAAWPHLCPGAVTWVAGVVAGVVELSRLYHTAALDAFRLSLAGALLLGRVFTIWHFAVYWSAIGLAAWLDAVFLRDRVK